MAPGVWHITRSSQCEAVHVIMRLSEWRHRNRDLSPTLAVYVRLNLKRPKTGLWRTHIYLWLVNKTPGNLTDVADEKFTVIHPPASPASVSRESSSISISKAEHVSHCHEWVNMKVVSKLFQSRLRLTQMPKLAVSVLFVCGSLWRIGTEDVTLFDALTRPQLSLFPLNLTFPVDTL